MALLDMGTAPASTIGNPTTGNYFIFLDSDNSDRLTTRDSAGIDTLYTSGVIPTTLTDLTDVIITTPLLGDVLEFDGTDFVNSPLSAPPIGIDDLTDVNVPSPSDEQILEYNNSSSKWESKDKSVYGTELNIFTDPTLTVTTSTSYTDIINDLTTTIPVGTYEILVSFSISNDSTNSDGMVRLNFDGAPITPTAGNAEIYRYEPKDHSGNTPVGSQSSQKIPITFVYPLDVTVLGKKSIDLGIKSEVGGVETSIWNVYIKIIRIL